MLHPFDRQSYRWIYVVELLNVLELKNVERVSDGNEFLVIFRHRVLICMIV